MVPVVKGSPFEQVVVRLLTAKHMPEGVSKHISVCVCTYQRPGLLMRLLEAVARQKIDSDCTLDIVVVDNDRNGSSRDTVMAFAESSPIKVTYSIEPRQNIALARNLVVANAKGNYLAFIDDDEFPLEDWLQKMMEACERFKVAGVLGPVLPHFDDEPPAWLKKGRFYDRPRHQSGFELGWQEARTGNVLIRRELIEGVAEVFRSEFGTGGEDQDFFRRMMEAGHRFVWCDEAPVYETVPSHRWSRKFLLHRALLRGKTTFRHGQNLTMNMAKSLVAVPLYSLALPVLFILGHHHFMRYLVRLCDHGGRLLAFIRLNPVSERCN
jgi:succinoglycan biosynthesis protein ExoM